MYISYSLKELESWQCCPEIIISPKLINYSFDEALGISNHATPFWHIVRNELAVTRTTVENILRLRQKTNNTTTTIRRRPFVSGY